MVGVPGWGGGGLVDEQHQHHPHIFGERQDHEHTCTTTSVHQWTLLWEERFGKYNLYQLRIVFAQIDVGYLMCWFVPEICPFV